MPDRIRHLWMLGFTLLEVVIVVALIAILSGMVTVLLFKSNVSANEASAIASLRIIGQAESQFRFRNSSYGTLTELKEGKFITDPELAKGDKSGYLFQVTPYGSRKYCWYTEAVPKVYGSTGVRSYYTDERGNIKVKDTGSGGFKPREEAIHWPPME